MTDTRDMAQEASQTSPPFEHIARQSSWNGATDGASLTPTHGRKRSADQISSEPNPGATRKGRACLACRRLKVKCDSLEQGDSGCSRCQRLGLDCITSKRLRVSLEDDGETSHPAIIRLDRAVDDILARLKMPSLESYSRAPDQPVTQTVERPHSPQASPRPPPAESAAQTTRENSLQPAQDRDDPNEVATAPMGSLYEVTQLNTLRSRLKYGDTSRSNSRKNMESDLIAHGHISLEEAEEMLSLFKTSLSRYLFDATINESRTLRSVRESSTLFFTAIITVTSLHIPGKEAIHATAHSHLRELIANSFFDRTHTLEDVRALTIAAFWLPDLSWKLSGHCVRMATELNLHQAFYKAMYSQKQSPQDREHALERARLWYLLYVLDHHFSIAYGRPPVTAELQAIKEYNVFLNAPECTPSDRRVLSQVTLFIILSKAYYHFGLEAERLMEGDDATLVTHGQFIEELDRWRMQFRHALLKDAHVGDYPAVGVELHYHFASMMLHSLSLRGRPLHTLHNPHTLPLSLRPLALRAIESAHSILNIVLSDTSIRHSMVGVPLYLHTMIAFAVVFLIKMSSRWTGIGVSIDPETRTKPLIEGVINLFRGSRAGKGHILYGMANGFERLLNRNLVTRLPGAVAGRTNGQTHDQAGSIDAARHHYTHQQSAAQAAPPPPPGIKHRPSNELYLHPPQHSTSPTPSQSQFQNTGYDPYSLSPNSQPTSTGTFGGWQTEDDMLWSMGMGWDLLATDPNVNSTGWGSWNMGDGGGYSMG